MSTIILFRCLLPDETSSSQLHHSSFSSPALRTSEFQSKPPEQRFLEIYQESHEQFGWSKHHQVYGSFDLMTNMPLTLRISTIMALEENFQVEDKRLVPRSLAKIVSYAGIPTTFSPFEFSFGFNRSITGRDSVSTHSTGDDPSHIYSEGFCTNTRRLTT